MHYNRLENNELNNEPTKLRTYENINTLANMCFVPISVIKTFFENRYNRNFTLAEIDESIGKYTGLDGMGNNDIDEFNRLNDGLNRIRWESHKESYEYEKYLTAKIKSFSNNDLLDWGIKRGYVEKGDGIDTLVRFFENLARDKGTLLKSIVNFNKKGKYNLTGVINGKFYGNSKLYLEKAKEDFLSFIENGDKKNLLNYFNYGSFDGKNISGADGIIETQYIVSDKVGDILNGVTSISPSSGGIIDSQNKEKVFQEQELQKFIKKVNTVG